MPDSFNSPAIIQQAINVFTQLREDLIGVFEAIEDEAQSPLYHGQAGRFTRTAWRRGDGTQDQGGGEAGLLRGRIFEKAGIHFSHVYGPMPEALAAQVRGGKATTDFTAAGVSLIAHPINPQIPSVHMNIRIVSTNQTWFGGGGDLTPMLDTQRHATAKDTQAFHQAMQKVCAEYPCADYESWREACDRYFFLPHRNEARGTGGIFFEHLNAQAAQLAFVQAFGQSFARIYAQIVRQSMQRSWNAAMREEQLIRRGRYVEFNLLYDRGTSFGLKSGGHIDSILSSLPPIVRWP